MKLETSLLRTYFSICFSSIIIIIMKNLCKLIIYKYLGIGKSSESLNCKTEYNTSEKIQ